MNLVSLLILPAIISLSNVGSADEPFGWLKSTPKAGGYAVAAVALVVLLVAIAFSKREGAGIAGDSGGEPAAAHDGEGPGGDAVEPETASVS